MVETSDESWLRDSANAPRGRQESPRRVRTGVNVWCGLRSSKQIADQRSMRFEGGQFSAAHVLVDSPFTQDANSDLSHQFHA